MATDRRTSTRSKSNPKAGVARQWGKMVEAWCLGFHGSVADLEAGKGHRRVKARFYLFLRDLVEEAANAILAFIGLTAIPALPGGEVSALFPQERQANGLKCWWGSNFQKIFGGMRLDPPPAVNLESYRLTEQSVDDPIIRTLGGKEMVATSLGYIAHLISLQPNGEEDGPLLVSGAANIFYVLDDRGDLWAVVCDWDAVNREWDLGATPVAAPGGWDAGNQVFVCDSSES